MSYPMDLDDYSDERLGEELQRRYGCRQSGTCDYCGRALRSEPACSKPQRRDMTGDVRLEWLK